MPKLGNTISMFLGWSSKKQHSVDIFDNVISKEPTPTSFEKLTVAPMESVEKMKMVEQVEIY